MMEACVILPQGQAVQLDLFELAPEVHVQAKPLHVRAPRHGLVVWRAVPNEPGKFVPVLETQPAIIELSKWNEGLMGCNRWQITALVDAGFVEGERITPRRLMINLHSYFAHRAKMRENPWFWQDEDNRKRYAKALARTRPEGRHGRKKEEADLGDSEGGLPFGAVETPPARENAGNRHGGRGDNGVREEGTRPKGPGARD